MCLFQDKAPYVATAEKKKVEYEKALRAYNISLVNYLFCIDLILLWIVLSFVMFELNFMY